MTGTGAAVIVVLVLLSVLVGAYVAVALEGGDTSPLVGAAGAAAALLGGLIVADYVRSRRNGR